MIEIVNGGSDLTIRHLNATSDSLDLPADAFGCLYIIDMSTDLYDFGSMPQIKSENAGKSIYIKTKGSSDKNWVGMNAFVGQSIDDTQMTYAIWNTHTTQRLMSDGVSNWIIISSNATVGTPFIGGGTFPIPEFADNTSAIAGGLSNGAMYRTVDVLKVVHESQPIT